MDRVLAQFEELVSVSTATPGASAWTGREAGTGRRVLIKRLIDDGAKTRATQALSLQHPRIVPTRRWLRDGDGFYVVRDYVPGRNLRQALSDTSQRAFDRLHARLLPLLEALDYAHSAGLSHGAVTAENVLAGEQFPEYSLLSDFAAARTPSEAVSRRDFAGLCGLYKDFLPARPADDEAGTAARARLLRNLSETQETTQSAEELRYKLDAIARMAALLGFDAADLEADGTPRPRLGSRLVCTVTPPTATVTPGGGTTVTLALDNEGDSPLHLESVTSDVIWLNLPNGFTPVDLAPGTGGDLLWTVSGARLSPGAYSATLSIRSSDGSTTLPSPGASWVEQKIAVPVLVKPAGTDDDQAAVPLAENLSHASVPPIGPTGEHPGIACVQDPDPGRVRYGMQGVVHLGVQNTGPTRLRIERIHTRPKWLTYPGDLKAIWIEPGETRFLGFALDGAGLAGGDYTAQVTFTTSIVSDTLLGPKPVWRDMSCEVRVRVVRDTEDALPVGLGKTGCVPLLLAGSVGLTLLAFSLRNL
ncbi:MAG: protein kinase domain-containing protein [Janthinobacterium lividum]